MALEDDFSGSETEDPLLDLVDEMHLDGESDSELEDGKFDIDQYVAENPGSMEHFSGIPADKLDDYWTIFTELDDDNSNEVSAKEMHQCFRQMGIPVDSEELKRIISSTDEDGSGEIDFAEFARMLFTMHQKMLEEPIEVKPGHYMVKEAPKASCWASTKVKLWMLMDDPSSSIAAQLLSALVILLIMVSCITFVVESLPAFHKEYEDIFFIIEAVCVAVFTAEYLLRVLSAPVLKAFLLEPLSIIDLVAIVPFYLLLVFETASLSGSTLLRIVRLVRVFRLFKMRRYMHWLGIVTNTMAASFMPLGMIIFVFSIGVVVFSSAEYYVERGEWDEARRLYVDKSGNATLFQSIPATFWWCTVTMTTVGYGDVVPQTILGRVVAGLASLTGVLILAIPISVISANFHTEYAKMTKKRESEMNHQADIATTQAILFGVRDPLVMNRKVARNAASLVHHNSRMMAGHLKHVELQARTELVKEMSHDLEVSLRRLVPVEGDPPLARKQRMLL